MKISSPYPSKHPPTALLNRLFLRSISIAEYAKSFSKLGRFSLCPIPPPSSLHHHRKRKQKVAHETKRKSLHFVPKPCESSCVPRTLKVRLCLRTLRVSIFSNKLCKSPLRTRTLKVSCIAARSTSPFALATKGSLSYTNCTLYCRMCGSEPNARNTISYEL